MTFIIIFQGLMMDNLPQILTSLVLIAFVIMITPSILARNKGKILQNIALWMAIFLGLAVAYNIIGPGKNHLRTENQEISVPDTATQIIGNSSIAPRTKD